MTTEAEHDREARMRTMKERLWADSISDRSTVATAIEEAAFDLVGRSLSPLRREQALQAAHRLAGTLGMFGFDEASDLARQFEAQLTRADDLDDGERLEMCAWAVAISDAALSPSVPSPPAEYDADPDVKVEIDALLGDVMLVEDVPRGNAHGLGTVAPCDGADSDVLVVDDDAAIVALLTTALENHGIRTSRATDGEAALSGLLSGALRPRLVLLDIGLPGMDGLTVLRQLGEAGLLEDMHVIMLTLRSGDVDMLAALRAGAFDYVTKPFSLGVLIERVRRALRNEAVRTDSLPAS